MNQEPSTYALRVTVITPFGNAIGWLAHMGRIAIFSNEGYAVEAVRKLQARVNDSEDRIALIEIDNPTHVVIPGRLAIDSIWRIAIEPKSE